ncbi:MAG: hypothetical protein AMXMBFR84_10010 [Candidatus Hydrogenedentota bacterium]
MKVGLRLCAVFAIVAGFSVARAAEYELDAVHSTFVFEVGHMGVGVTVGRFNDSKGTFEFDAATKSLDKIDVAVQTGSVDTANEARDSHLKNEDFFDVNTFPTMSFKSTSVKAKDEGYSVTGDFTLHGVTKEIVIDVAFIGAAKGHQGEDRVGFTTEFQIKRSEYGMDKLIPGASDEVTIRVAVEGTSGGKKA